jgi:hypothetical protein
VLDDYTAKIELRIHQIKAEAQGYIRRFNEKKQTQLAALYQIKEELPMHTQQALEDSGGRKSSI